jgi:hypothetical protein
MYFGFMMVRFFFEPNMSPETDVTLDVLHDEIMQIVLDYEEGKAPAIDFSEISMFPWDRIYVFSPYTSLSTLDFKFGIFWRKQCYTEIDMLEGYTLLVFAKSKKVVHCLEYSLEYSNFPPLAKYTGGISKQDALFVFNEFGEVIIK